MSHKKAKRAIWVECDRCRVTITTDINSHIESNCLKNQEKYPYIENKTLYTCLEKTFTPYDRTPKDVILLHPSTADLIGAVLGAPLLLNREGAPTLLKRMWPSKNLTPSIVSMPTIDLPQSWCLDNIKKVNVSVLQEDVPVATKVTFKILNNKLNEDISDILKQQFINKFISVNYILYYYYFGKKLKIEISDITCDKDTNTRYTWFILSENTLWALHTNVSPKIDKKIVSLGGIDDIVDEIVSDIKISFSLEGLAVYCQPIRGILLHGHSGVGKTAICKYIINTMKYSYVEISSTEILSKYLGETESKMKSLFAKAIDNEPSIIFIDKIETICPKKYHSSSEHDRRVASAFFSLLDSLHESKTRVFILATTSKPEYIDPLLRTCGRIDKELEVPVPDRFRRKNILLSLLSTIPNKISTQDMNSIADLAHGYVAADLVSLCTQASMRCMKRSSTKLEKEDLLGALTVLVPSAMRELLIEVPNVRWSDIGGQGSLKLKLRQAVEWPLKHADSFRRLGVKAPSGVLMYGPPGCSKTMIAKALATESGLNFLSIKGPELFSKFVGDSEKAVRDLFAKARQVAPSVIFFDEIDALVGERSGSGEGSVYERVVAQLLIEMDGVVPLNSVTILAATNRPDRVDQALLRPGRLDRLVYVPLPDYETRLEILELKLGKMSISDDINMHNLAARTEGFSGAELHALCNEAAFKALENDIDCTEVKNYNFEDALKDFKPRTSKSLLKIYENFVGAKI